MTVPLGALAGLFLRAGNLTFGGGDAITAVLQRELVVRRAWITLDEFASSEDVRVNILKLDVQGADALVIAGGERVFSQDPLTAFVEWWPDGLRSHGGGAARGPGRPGGRGEPAVDRSTAPAAGSRSIDDGATS